MTTLAKKQGNTLGLKYTKGEAPCAGGCGKMTRPKGTSLADHPRTVSRTGKGMCSGCYGPLLRAKVRNRAVLKYPILQCTAPGCEAMTRSMYDNPDLAPGTRRRVSKGVCSECYKKKPEVVDTARVEKVASELDGFLAARRKRAEAAARRAAAVQALGRRVAS